MVIRAYSYFSTSRSLYQKLRKDYKLPSVKTLTNLISKVTTPRIKSFWWRRFRESWKLSKRTHDNDGLQTPIDIICQWTIFCYCMLAVCVELHWLIFSWQYIQLYSLDQNMKKAKTLAYIFLNNHCRLTTPRSKKEPSSKVLKLSEKVFLFICHWIQNILLRLFFYCVLDFPLKKTSKMRHFRTPYFGLGKLSLWYFLSLSNLQ